MQLMPQLEAILFVLAKPVSFSKLAKWTNTSIPEVEESLKQYAAMTGERGINITLTNSEAQLTTAPAVHDIVSQVVKDERTGDLTKPSLETLSIIAYRSPIAKTELEAIRGVNCSLIIRNLLIRGLVTETFDKLKGIEVYDITPEYLQLLGVQTVQDLPEYERLHRDIQLGERLAFLDKPGDFFTNNITNDGSDTPTE
ncbi:MAG: SMC-Scp complex subunit ScpB [Patescibacteria group bacterium]|jgi:segregation and condensation protein B